MSFMRLHRLFANDDAVSTDECYGLYGSLADPYVDGYRVSPSVVVHLVDGPATPGRQAWVEWLQTLAVRLHVAMWPTRAPLFISLDPLLAGDEEEASEWARALHLPEWGLSATAWSRRLLVVERHEQAVRPSVTDTARMVCLAAALAPELWASVAESKRVVPPADVLTATGPVPPPASSVHETAWGAACAVQTADVDLASAVDALHRAAASQTAYGSAAMPWAMNDCAGTMDDTKFDEHIDVNVVVEPELTMSVCSPGVPRGHVFTRHHLMERLSPLAQMLAQECAVPRSPDTAWYEPMQQWRAISCTLAILEWYVHTGQWAHPTGRSATALLTRVLQRPPGRGQCSCTGISGAQS
jgi:hypothetical protein